MNPYYQFAAKLECGAAIEFIQMHQHGLLTITITPPDNIPVADVGKIKDDKIVINATIESLAGVYQMFKRMAGEATIEKKSWWKW